MTKKKMKRKNVSYKLRNWNFINEAGVVRGEFFLELDWVQNWHKELEEMNAGKVGSPYEFPESMIQLQAFWHQFFSYRTVEGITRKVVSFSQLPKYNDFSTINRRVNNGLYEIPKSDKVNIEAATDGSGMKMTLSGEYLEDKHGKKSKRKKYIKVIVTGDVNEKDVLKVEVSLEGEGKSEPDCAMDHMKELMDEGKNIKSFFGDGGLDKHELFDFCDYYRINPIIKLPENAVIDPGGGNGSWRRSVEVRKYKEKGYEGWARKNRYGKRWPGTEGIFSAVKGIFGEDVRAKEIGNMCTEVRIKFWAYQNMKRYAEKKVEGHPTFGLSSLNV